MSVSRPTRPLLRYLGGKWRLAPWIIEHLPPHRVYVEPFGGAANVLLRKPRAQTEVYNDLDDDVVNLFRVLRDPAQACALQALLRLTPYARTEWSAAYESAADPVEKARRLIVRSYMGFGSCASRVDRTTGFRSGDRGPHRPASSEWSGFPDALSAIVGRMADVTIECRPAAQVIADRDGEDAVFYVDPPYVHATRSPKRTRTAPSNGYAHELTDAGHADLLDQLLAVGGGCCPVGLCLPAVRSRTDRLAAGRARHPGRWCPSPPRGVVDQPVGGRGLGCMPTPARSVGGGVDG